MAKDKNRSMEKIRVVDWEHIKQICENVIKDGKSAQDLYLTLIFAVEKVGNVLSYEVEHDEKTHKK